MSLSEKDYSPGQINLSAIPVPVNFPEFKPECHQSYRRYRLHHERYYSRQVLSTQLLHLSAWAWRPLLSIAPL